MRISSKVVVGAIMVVAGLVTIVGGITGNLGSMIAAFFDPSDLTSNKKSS